MNFHKCSSFVVLLLSIYFKPIWCTEIQSFIQNVTLNSNNNNTKVLNSGHGLQKYLEMNQKPTQISTGIINRNHILKSNSANIDTTILSITRETRSAEYVSAGHIKRIVKKNLEGFTIDNDGKFKQTTKKVATLKNSHFDSTDPQPFDQFELKYTFSENVFDQMKQGINSSSLSLEMNSRINGIDVNISSGHDESNSTFTLYNMGRILFKKKQIKLHSSQLSLDTSFYSWIVAAVDTGLVNIQSAENLVKVLNQYGWYLPIEYVLGGAKLEIQNTTVKNSEEVVCAINSFNTKFQSIPFEFDASPSDELRTTTIANGDNHLEFIGGIVSENNEMFIRSLNDPNNWDIIEYIEFMPTLQLLYYRNQFLYEHCLKLLRQFHSNSTIKTLQNYINIHDYAMKLELMRLVV